MPGKVQLAPISDFTGGLNLRDDAFQLKAPETPDCCNVDLLPQGGFERRKSVAKFNSAEIKDNDGTPASGRLQGWIPFVDASGNDELLVGINEDLSVVQDDGSHAEFTMSGTGTYIQGFQAEGLAWIVRGNNETAYSSTGAAVTSQTNIGSGNWEESLTTPTSTAYPRGRCSAYWHGFAFVANMTYDATSYPDRIHFSHPANVNYWRELDWLDVSPGDGDAIQALIPMGDQLFIFKSRSIQVLTGYGPDSFQLLPFTTELGATNPYHVAASEKGIAFFDPMEGVHIIFRDGQIRPMWEKLHHLLNGGNINGAALDMVRIGWIDERLFVSVPYGAAQTTNNRTFVYDSYADAWYKYDYGLTSVIDWRRDTEKDLHLGGSDHYDGWLLSLDDGVGQDDLGNGAVDFDSSYTTAWIDLDLPGIKKRFRRPIFIVDGADAAVITVRSYRDFDVAGTARTFTLDITGYDSDDDLIWDTGQWHDGTPTQNWATNLDGAQSIEKGSSLGRAQAVQLVFDGPVDSHWAMNAIQMKYIVPRIR